jgi:hypothetical protein
MARGSRPGERRGGRQKGTPNKLPTIRAAFEGAFHALQKQPDKPHALSTWARDNPTEFYKLAARLIPNEIVGDVSLQVNILRYSDAQ